MTSSLVGSEMCIRDRSNGPCKPLRTCATCSASERASPVLVGRTLNPPVSYTHLTLPTICSV
eukprot:6102316-Prorocentrum_lima.AAC.1